MDPATGITWDRVPAVTAIECGGGSDGGETDSPGGGPDKEVALGIATRLRFAVVGSGSALSSLQPVARGGVYPDIVA